MKFFLKIILGIFLFVIGFMLWILLNPRPTPTFETQNGSDFGPLSDAESVAYPAYAEAKELLEKERRSKLDAIARERDEKLAKAGSAAEAQKVTDAFLSADKKLRLQQNIDYTKVEIDYQKNLQQALKVLEAQDPSRFQNISAPDNIKEYEREIKALEEDILKYDALIRERDEKYANVGSEAEMQKARDAFTSAERKLDLQSKIDASRAHLDNWKASLIGLKELVTKDTSRKGEVAKTELEILKAEGEFGLLEDYRSKYDRLVQDRDEKYANVGAEVEIQKARDAFTSAEKKLNLEWRIDSIKVHLNYRKVNLIWYKELVASDSSRGRIPRTEKIILDSEGELSALKDYLANYQALVRERDAKYANVGTEAEMKETKDAFTSAERKLDIESKFSNRAP